MSCGLKRYPTVLHLPHEYWAKTLGKKFWSKNSGQKTPVKKKGLREQPLRVFVEDVAYREADARMKK